MMICEKCKPRELEAMRALESLTPSGSEFVNDPKRCVEFARDRMNTVVKFAGEAKRLREALLVIANTANAAFDSDDKAERFDEMTARLDAIAYIIGDALKRQRAIGGERLATETR